MKRLIVLQDAVDIIANTPSEIANRVARGSKTHWTTKEVLGALADRQFEIFVLLDMVKRVDATEAVKVETNIYDKEEIYPDCTNRRFHIPDLADICMSAEEFCCLGERKENER